MRDILPPEELHQIFSLDADEGKLYWLPRPMSMFKTERIFKSWNTKFAGKEALISDNGVGYKYGTIFNKRYYAHRVIFAMVNGKWPNAQTDHINHDRSDNRPDNLRSVTRQENQRNQSIRVTNTSGTLGVSWKKRDKRWCAAISVNGKHHNLGNFKCITAAAVARKQAEVLYGYHVNHGN